MTVEFERLSKIESSKNKRFNLDRIFPVPMRDLVDPTDKILINKIHEGKKEFQKNEASHVWLTFKIISDTKYIDATMNDKRAAMILNYLFENQSDKKYILNIKFIVLRNDNISRNASISTDTNNWIIRDKRDPVLHNEKTAILSKSSKPGMLTGIDKLYYERSYPVTAVIYGIYPLSKPNIDKLKPMKFSENSRFSTINCVAERITEHFSVSTRGNRLTDKRRNIINSWAEIVKFTGASIKDVAELEKKLKFPITIKTITGEVLYESKYKSKGASIEIVDHNEHAWTNAVTIFPRTRTVKFYNGEMFDLINEISKNDPVSVWLFSSEDESDQFVRPNGDIYRTESLQEKMKEYSQTFKEFHDEKLFCECFTVPSVAAHYAREKNSWKPTRFDLLDDIILSCVEYGHGGLWNCKYSRKDLICVDMVACYPGSFLGYGECSEYFKRFGHPTNEMTRVSINGPLPDFDITGFACIESFKFVENLHPICYVWFGRHFSEKKWAPIVLLRYMLDSLMLKSLLVSEAIISYRMQTEVWLPEQREYSDEENPDNTDYLNQITRDLGRKIIGKFTQGGSYDHKRHCTRLIMDDAELNFIIADTTNKNTFRSRETAFLSNGTKLGTIVSYIDGESPQYTHLRSSMLAYVSVNLLSMINKVSQFAVRVATDSFYISKKHLQLLDKLNILNHASWGEWRIKKETILDYSESADVPIKDIYRKTNRILKSSSAPSIYDPVSRHKTIYLNGPGGSGKTTRAIELFKNSDMIVLTPTHRLAREMTQRGTRSCTYHSFFRWSGDAWNPDRMGDKYIPKIIVWDEICTVSLDNLRLFLNWLVTKNTAVVMCGDHGQPPPFVGPSPHEWLKRSVDYYEEITDDHRALDSTLREFKNLIRLQPNKIQCEVMRNIISETSLNDFWDMWRPNDLIVASRKIVRDTLQQKLYILHKEKFAELPVPLCYRPADTRRQNILVDIPGQTEKRNLVLNDIVLVDVNVVDSALSEWTLGYAMTIHSSQGLTISDTVVWIVDDHIAWSNLVYLAVSRVRKISQLRRIVVGESETSGNVDNDIVKKN